MNTSVCVKENSQDCVAHFGIMESMEVIRHGVDVKLAGVKRKAEAEELRDNKKQPTKVSQPDSGFGKLPVPGSFLKLQEVLEICRHSSVLESVPPGKKSNVFFIIDDSINALKRERNEPPKYYDDCGEWKSKDFSRNFYVENFEGNIRCLKTRDNLFYKDSHAKGGSFLTPLNPQPDPNTLLKVYRRIFESARARNSYKKRVTALSGNGMRSIALVEYSDSNNAASLVYQHVHEADKKGAHNVAKSSNAAVNSIPLHKTKKGVHNAEKSSNTAVNSKPMHKTKKESVHNAEKSSNTAVNSKPLHITKKESVHNAEKSSSIAVNSKPLHITKKESIHHAEKSSNIAVNSKPLHITKKESVHNAEKSSNIAVNSKPSHKTKKGGVHNSEKSSSIAVNSKHVLGSKKKVVHNVVKRPRGRPRLNRVHNVVKRPRGRPSLNRVQNVIKRPKGRPPLDRVKYGNIKAKHHTSNKIHTRSSKYKFPTPEESEANGTPAFETHQELLRHDKWVPRGSKQASHKPVNTATGMQKEQTSAECDDDLLMVGMLEENPSVQEVINRKLKPPCVILYSDKQFSDMKRNLECESILGVDCTHKFGDCYVTMTVYQNSRALHEDTNEPLLFLGPVYLHWDKEFFTYVSFFSHLMDKLEGVEPVIEVKLGNDVELPLFKALKFSFPTSPCILDCHHLKKTVNKELLAIVSDKPESCSAILDQIFGKEGIINSSCLPAFENGVLGLACYFDEFPSLKSSFDDLQLLLYPYVCEPHQRGITQKLWVNGNDEVLNNQFDTVLKFRQNKLSKIVEKICAISRMQMLELKDV